MSLMISAERIQRLSPRQKLLLRERLANSNAATGTAQEIVAYLVSQPGRDLSLEKLREFLLAQLPDFMVPARFVVLERLPLQPNGKVDRKALPSQEPEQSRSPKPSAIQPRTTCEIQLARIWTEVLHVATPAVEDNFFQLGGHSLLALQLLTRVRHVFKVELPLKAVFESPTIAALARAIEMMSKAPPLATPIQPIARRHSTAPSTQRNT
ncbi:MAG: phosphopantetheine-binding protein [Verrucomicrobiota bacterium]